MRYYDILITTPDPSGIIGTGETPVNIDGQDMHFTSYKTALGGMFPMTIPGALNIEMDIPMAAADVTVGGTLKIWGISLSLINNASKLNGKNITIKSGMQKGLPLATKQAGYKPSRNGIICRGRILQAFGNWQGGEQTLDLILMVNPAGLIPATNKQFTFECKAGMKFEQAIAKTLHDAGINSSINISQNLTATTPINFYVPDIYSFAAEIKKESHKIIKDANYLGVNLIGTDTGFLCADNSMTAVESLPKVDFFDLIGQPAWLEFSIVQMKVMMRSDIKVGMTISMPQSPLSVTSAKSHSQWKDGIAYSGTGFVNKIRHIGNFRDPSANSWVTVIDVIKAQA